ncbi:MAG: nucleotidyl transferase AbiEii/AbiGii toxin family protein [Gemmataceae bacterium]
MSKDRLRNVAASVRQRLTALARARGEEFQLVLTNYVIERLLYRLGASPHGGSFVLKGAMLFRLWADQPHRPTRDVDLLGRGDPAPEVVAATFREVCGQAVEDDGLTFSPASVTAGVIKEDQEYEGVRVGCRVHLGQARIDLQIDVGFGDAVVPRATSVTYPTMLDFPAPVLKAYPMQAVVAEKFQAMVVLGIANSRMKDFFDLWVLANRFGFDGPSLTRALAATFRRRKTPVPAAPPLALTPAFGADGAKVTQWQAFRKKGKLDAGGATLGQVCAFLNGFLMPPSSALSADEEFARVWAPGGPWA